MPHTGYAIHAARDQLIGELRAAAADLIWLFECYVSDGKGTVPLLTFDTSEAPSLPDEPAPELAALVAGWWIREGRDQAAVDAEWGEMLDDQAHVTLCNGAPLARELIAALPGRPILKTRTAIVDSVQAPPDATPEQAKMLDDAYFVDGDLSRPGRAFARRFVTVCALWEQSHLPDPPEQTLRFGYGKPASRTITFAATGIADRLREVYTPPRFREPARDDLDRRMLLPIAAHWRAGVSHLIELASFVEHAAIEIAPGGQEPPVEAETPAAPQAGGRRLWEGNVCPICGNEGVEAVSQRKFAKLAAERARHRGTGETSVSRHTIRKRIADGTYCVTRTGKLPWCHFCYDLTPEGGLLSYFEPSREERHDIALWVCHAINAIGYLPQPEPEGPVPADASERCQAAYDIRDAAMEQAMADSSKEKRPLLRQEVESLVGALIEKRRQQG